MRNKKILELELLESLNVKKQIPFEDDIDPLFLFTIKDKEGKISKMTFKEIFADDSKNGIFVIDADELLKSLKNGKNGK